MKYPGLGLTILAYGYTMERFFSEQKANWRINWRQGNQYCAIKSWLLHV